MPKSPSGVLLQGLTLERSSGVPLYKQLETGLRKLILSGTLRARQKLPSTRELAGEIGISRITIKSVYEQLVAEGYVQATSGSGTFVADGLEIEVSPQVGRLPDEVPRKINLTDRARSISSTNASVRQGKTEPFRPGVPALDLFPIKPWNKYLREATNTSYRDLSYGSVKGNADLRRSIASYLSDARGMQADSEQIVITSGAQQAFVLIAFSLLTRGDTVWYENPGHIAGRDIMQVMGANVAPVPIDAEGIDLEFAIKNYPSPKLIFTTPSHQQPLGTTMSLARRLSLLSYAQENDAWIIEDDYDSEFRYRGRPLPALSALDSERRVLYVGTFSKSMFAAIRLGYIVVPPEMVDAIGKTKILLGQNSSPLVEQALSRFMDDGRFVEHIRRMRRVYRERRDLLFDCLSSTCAESLTPQPTDAGMHMLAWLNGGVSDLTAHRALLDVGIESLPLSVYSVYPIERSALVLGFSNVREERLPGLVGRMSNTLRSLSDLRTLHGLK
jgi:GntR family transcriptional regulator/MocR family aminotransferase|tara:strand:+ start:7544 stop:9046 length:1503 start_codon:yes stop_codon:yes gene_type:complete